MTALKKWFLVFLLVVGLGWLARGPIFRLLFSYKNESSKAVYSIENQAFIQKMNALKIQTDPEKIIETALELTAEKLHFSTQKAAADPNLLFENGAANCIGYAAFFCSTSRLLFKKAGLESEFEIEHRRGRIFFGNLDLCSFSKNSFWKNHDFAVVKNRKTGQTSAIDPSLFDYSGIKTIRQTE